MAKTGPKTEEGKQKSKANLKQFEPGKSGNPKGRPVGSRTVKKVFEEIANLSVSLPDNEVFAMLKQRFPEYFDEEGKATLLELTALRMALGALVSDKDKALKYMDKFLDRLDGRPAQSHVSKNSDGEEVERQTFSLGDGIEISFP